MSRPTRSRVMLALVAVSAVVASACGGESGSSDQTEPTAQDAETGAVSSTTGVGRGGATPSTASGVNVSASTLVEQGTVGDPDSTVRIILTLPPQSWDPHKSTTPNAAITFTSQIYDRLLYLEADGTLSPMLATSWRFSEDGLGLDLELRDDVTFHNGEVFDAEVAASNLIRAKDLGLAVAPQLANVVSAEATAPHILHLTLDHSDPAFLFNLATVAGSIISPSGMNDPGLEQAPSGSGPFTLVSSDSTRVVFQRNDDYWNKDLVLPASKELLIAEDEVARINALEAGDVDAAGGISAASLPSLQRKIDDGTYNLYSYNSYVGIVLKFNTTLAPLDQSEVRTAINLAIDRDLLNDVAQEGAGDPKHQIVASGFPGNVDGLRYDYDPDEARTLLDRAGVSDVTMELVMPTVEPYATIAQLIQQQFAAVGITVNLQSFAATEARPAWREGAFHMALLGDGLTNPDPSSAANNFLGPDQPGPIDETLQQLVNEASAFEIGEARTKAFEAVSRYIFEEALGAPTVTVANIYLARPSVLGMDQMPFASQGRNQDTLPLILAMGR